MLSLPDGVKLNGSGATFANAGVTGSSIRNVLENVALKTSLL